jgi:hypothetical protein
VLAVTANVMTSLPIVIVFGLELMFFFLPSEKGKASMVKMMKAMMMQSPELMESGKKYTRSLSFLLPERGKA